MKEEEGITERDRLGGKEEGKMTKREVDRQTDRREGRMTHRERMK